MNRIKRDDVKLLRDRVLRVDKLVYSVADPEQGFPASYWYKADDFIEGVSLKLFPKWMPTDKDNNIEGTLEIDDSMNYIFTTKVHFTGAQLAALRDMCSMLLDDVAARMTNEELAAKAVGGPKAEEVTNG